MEKDPIEEDSEDSVDPENKEAENSGSSEQ